MIQARCDGAGCDAVLEMSANTDSADLRRANWTQVDEFVYCPTCHEKRLEDMKQLKSKLLELFPFNVLDAYKRMNLLNLRYRDSLHSSVSDKDAAEIEEYQRNYYKGCIQFALSIEEIIGDIL